MKRKYITHRDMTILSVGIEKSPIKYKLKADYFDICEAFGFPDEHSNLFCQWRLQFTSSLEDVVVIVNDRRQLNRKVEDRDKWIVYGWSQINVDSTVDMFNERIEELRKEVAI